MSKEPDRVDFEAGLDEDQIEEAIKRYRLFPELLEAAKEALCVLKNEQVLNPGKYWAVKEILEKVIAKAEGKEGL